MIRYVHFYTGSDDSLAIDNTRFLFRIMAKQKISEQTTTLYNWHLDVIVYATNVHTTYLFPLQRVSCLPMLLTVLSA